MDGAVRETWDDLADDATELDEDVAENVDASDLDAGARQVGIFGAGWRKDSESLSEAGNGLGETERRPANSEVWARYPGKYNVPSERVVNEIGERQGPFEDPRRWVDDVNPGGPRGLFTEATDPMREDNCADCARAVERNWRGDAQVSAGRTELAGEGDEITQQWIGDTFRSSSVSEIEDSLRQAGPGASAIIHVGWKDDPMTGHAFNAVNHEGTILAVDGQNGAVEGWPPSEQGLGYAEDDFCEVLVITWGCDGKEIR